MRNYRKSTVILFLGFLFGVCAGVGGGGGGTGAGVGAGAFPPPLLDLNVAINSLAVV